MNENKENILTQEATETVEKIGEMADIDTIKVLKIGGIAVGAGVGGYVAYRVGKKYVAPWVKGKIDTIKTKRAEKKAKKAEAKAAKKATVAK